MKRTRLKTFSAFKTTRQLTTYKKAYFINPKETYKNSKKLLRTLGNPNNFKGTYILWITLNLMQKTCCIPLWTFEMPYQNIKDNDNKNKEL